VPTRETTPFAPVVVVKAKVPEKRSYAGNFTFQKGAGQCFGPESVTEAVEAQPA
jgi:hypothetical protein